MFLLFFSQDDESINKIISTKSSTAATPTATATATTTPTADVVVAFEVQVVDEDGEQQLEPEEVAGDEEEGIEIRGHERPNSLEMFDLLTRLQSSRLDDQRCPMPSSPLTTTTTQSAPQQQPPLPHQQNTILRSEAKTRFIFTFEIFTPTFIGLATIAQ
jgi:hypothetical protein